MKNIFRLFSFLILVTGFASCTNYGKSVKHGHVEVFYKDGISKEQAQKTADLLYLADAQVNNNTSTKKSVQLIQNKDTFYFRMVVNKVKLASVDDETFVFMGNVISDSIFNGSPVNVDLTDDHLKTIRTVHYHKVDMNSGGN